MTVVRRLAGGASLLAVLALVASGCKFDGAYDLPLPGGIVSDEDSYAITADFADVLSVVPRTAVMVDDVPVGEVKDVERVGWHAHLTIWVRNDVDLPDNAIAEIRQTSLLGEKYVALLPPTDEKPRGELSDGDTIGLDETGRNPEVEEVLGALSFLLSGGGVGQLATITHELNAIMDGRSDRLRSLLSRLDGVVGTIDDQKGEIIRALTAINGLTSTLNREKQTIGAAIDAVGPAVQVLSSQHKNLVKMLRSLDRLGAIGTAAIGASKDDLLATLRDLQPVLTKLNESGKSIGPGLSLLLSFPFPKESNDIVHGDYANTIMQVNVTLENLQNGTPGGPGGPLPTLPVPSLPLPSLPLPSLPTIPLPSIPGLPLPSLPGLPLVAGSGLPREVASGQPAAQTARHTSATTAACAESGNLLGGACDDSIATTAGFRALMTACRTAAYLKTSVCRSLSILPALDVSGNGALARALDPFGQALTTAWSVPFGTQQTLYGAGDGGQS